MTRAELLCAAIGNAAEIALIHKECFGDQCWSRGSIALMLAGPETFGYLVASGAAQEEGPAGFCLARIAGDECELLSLGVRHGHRRQGLGRQLLQAVKDRAKDRCCARVYLEVADSNDAALQLYFDSGFAVVGRRKGYYKTTEGSNKDALVLGTVGHLA